MRGLVYRPEAEADIRAAFSWYEHQRDGIAALGDDPNVIFCTGPSKTADVEGILIEGVHGPGEQVALIHAFGAT